MQQDYLLRMIQQLRFFMAGLLKIKEAGDFAEAESMIRDSYGRFAGLSPTLVHAISEDDLIQLLQARGGIEITRGMALAEILREEGLLFQQMGRHDEAFPRLLKSLRLYLELFDVDEEFSGRELPGMEDVISLLVGEDLPPITNRKLIAYLEWNGQYDLAENQLVHAVDDGMQPQADLHAFYNRLLILDDARLIVGGLNRAEVEQSLAELDSE